MKLASSIVLPIYGIMMLAALVVCSRCATGAPSFLISVMVAGLAYLFAVRELSRTKQFSRNIIFICLALSVSWRVAFLVTLPASDDDIHRYLWDGHIQRLGYNPYLVVPADPALAGLHTDETRGLNHPELPSPYPAGAQLFFRMVAAVHESIFAFKIAFLLCDALIIFLLLDLLRRTDQSEHWVLVYAWNPLLAICVAGSSHIDILGVLLLVISVAALARQWRMAAAIAFALAIAVKFLPIVLLPLYWRRVRLRDAVIAALVFILLYVPFLSSRHIPLGSLGTYVHSFRFNDRVFAMLEQVAGPQLAAAFALCLGMVVSLWLRRKSSQHLAGQFAWPMAASLACAPVIYPWYLLWLLPFVRSRSSVPLIVWTVSILPTFIVWHLRAAGKLWIIPNWVLLLEYGAVALAVGFSFRGSKKMKAGSAS